LKITSRMHRTSLRATDRRGGTIVFVTVFLTALTGMAFSLMTISLGSMGEQRGEREKLDAVFAAEAALGEAVFELETGGDGALGSAQQGIPFGSGTYWVTATDLGGGSTRLLATSRTERSEAQIELVLQEVITNMFAWAAFGDESLSLDSNAMVDSYDSSQGTYDSQEVNGNGNDRYANPNGHVGSNGDILASSNSAVHGDATPGPDSTTTIVGNAEVSGATAPMPNSMELPPITVPVFASSGELVVASGTTSIGPGDHHFDRLYIDTTATVMVTGPATLVFGSFELRSNSEFRVDATNGPVEIYVIDDFVLSSNTLVASTTYTPSDIRFNLLSDNVINPELEVELDEVEFESNAMLYGTVYAPNAAIEINSNFELFGSIVSRSLLLDSNSQVHFDEALLNAANQQQATYSIICERVLR